MKLKNKLNRINRSRSKSPKANRSRSKSIKALKNVIFRSTSITLTITLIDFDWFDRSLWSSLIDSTIKFFDWHPLARCRTKEQSDTQNFCKPVWKRCKAYAKILTAFSWQYKINFPTQTKHRFSEIKIFKLTYLRVENLFEHKYFFQSQV